MFNADKAPKVSILIPTYNYAHHLEEAVSSALRQTFTDFEVIIVDDNSSDDTDEVVKRFLIDNRVRYYKNADNLGLVGNFNKCLEYANGKYIKYLLADDKISELLLETFVPIMEADQSITLITSYSDMFGIKQKVRSLPHSGLLPGKKVIYECLLDGRGNWIGEPTVVMFRRESLKHGAFGEKYTCLVDLDMWLRLLMRGNCYIVPEVLSYFRHHPKQASSKTNVRNWIDEYLFYKDIRLLNMYELDTRDFSNLNIDHVIKDRAKHCAKGMVRILHRFPDPKYRKLIFKAFEIARSEKVLSDGIFSMVKKYLSFKSRRNSKISDTAYNL